MGVNDDFSAAAGTPGVLGLLGETLSPELVRRLLRGVIDPELGVNIVDLGLVYDVRVDDDTVAIEMTLTTPGCPLGGFLEDQIHGCLTPLPQVREVEVQLVWDPPWEPETMSATAKEQLDWL